MALPLPAPEVVSPRLYTTADLDLLPENWYQLTNGVLTVSPAPPFGHQKLSFELAVILRSLVPSDRFVVAMETGVDFPEDTYRVPDVTIARAPIEDEERHLRAEEVAVAIEVESPSSRHEDRYFKPALFALNGIPHYWRVEQKPLVVTAYALKEGRYVEVAAAGEGETLALEEPFPVRIAVSDLLPQPS